ncbi:N-acetylglucosamine transport system substrate-binding protein [Paenibacillus shirakamiensis]|uniref:N-acetylglucosamine transport system substrate-binding protein n=1 Tax=Paenibacillus shirakamiensis TaxID=1265935 RepID=A0ABS4JEP2_9BACL|nr:extracellular solute-binding protein [Paenibacillus shirakamiensis]MBP2000192.1 N-acetylglucosamine transport system substrate-binding protein [Paenibacillus shirakamiensis]
MKKQTKLFVVMTLTLSLILSIAGCSGTDSSSSKKKSNGLTANGLAGDFEIQYFVGGYGDAWWKDTIEQFQKLHPDLTIKQSAGPKINDQMKPRWIQGNPPDVVYIDGSGSNPRQMMDDHQLLDVTDWIKDAKNIDGEKLIDLMITEPEVYSGKTYTIPLVFGAYGNFYDQAFFDKNGWSVPQDYSSFLALSEKIKAAGISPYIHPGVYPEYIHGGFLFPAIISANGDHGEILKEMGDLKAGIFKSEPVMKALNQLSEISKLGYIDQASPAINHTDSQMLFLQHKAAFIPNGLWLESEMKNDTPADFKFGYIPSLTQSKGGKLIAIPYSTTLAIAKKAKNPEAAKAFIQFVFKKKNALNWAEKTGALMNVKTDLDSSEASPVAKTAMKFYNSDHTLVAPVVVFNSDVEKVMKDATIALTVGKIKPEEWAERVEAAAAKARK